MNKDMLKNLAYKMALNHIALSVNDIHWEDACKQILKYTQTEIYPEPIIIVVGAGASHPSGLPLAHDSAKELRERLNHVDQSILNYELERLEKVYKLNKNEFETMLLALSKFDPASLDNEIHDIFYRRFYPSYFYELLAHLLKHRFIDAIINFNFDELLDQSIEDELGNSDYYKIISDGDCPDNLFSIMDIHNHRFKLPLYIKPHGTASYKSTMRFTRDQYFGLPIDIENIIKELISRIPINLIVIGHSMQSFEFNYLIENQANSHSSIYFVNPVVPSNLVKTLQNLYSNGGFFPVSIENETNSLNNWASNLWGAIYEIFEDNYKPRTDIRHQLISELFSDKIDIGVSKDKRINDKVDYLKDRTIIELALAIAKSKGFIILNDLANNRAGKYYSLYKKFCIQPKTLLDFCNIMFLKDYGYSFESLKFFEKIQDDQSKETDFDKTVIDKGNENEVDTFLKRICELTDRNLSHQLRRRIKENESLFKETLKKMLFGEEVEICSRHENIYDQKFANPMILDTFTALKFHTKSLLLQDWDLLLIIAETGEWLFNDSEIINSNPKGKIAIILADSTYVSELENTFGDKIKNNIKVMPWWLHNQHMTIFHQDRRPKYAIYFTRRHRLSNINPVLIRDNDVDAIYDGYFAYWLKAEKFEQNQYQSIPIVNRREVEEMKTKLFRQLYPR